MATNSDKKMALGFVLGCLVLYVAITSGWIGGQTQSVGNGGTGATTFDTFQANGDLCTVNRPVTVRASLYNKVQEPDTLVATTFAGILKDSTVLTNSTTTSAATQAPLGGFECNDEVYFREGDGATYYFKWHKDQKVAQKLTSNSPDVNDEVWLIGSVNTLSFKNSTGTWSTSGPTGSIGLNIGTGGSATGYILISEATANAYAGVPSANAPYQLAVCYNYNKTNLTRIDTFDGSGYTVKQNVGEAYATQASGFEECDGIIIPGGLKHWEEITVTFKAIAPATVNPGSPAIAQIDVQVMDMATQWQDGDIYYVLENMNTGAAIGMTDVSTNCAFNIT